MIFSCKSARAVNASRVITKKGMLGRPVDPLVSSQIFRCDESFATNGAHLSSGPMPASVVALKVSAGYFYPYLVVERQATYSLSDFELKVLPQSWQDREVDDPA